MRLHARITLPAIICAAPTLAADGKDLRSNLVLMRAWELGPRRIAESNENDVCIREEDDFFDCLNQEPSCLEAENCRACLSNELEKIEDFDACYDITDTMCRALNKCDCGPCSGGFETWFDCLLDSSGYCQFNCDTYRARGLRERALFSLPDDNTDTDESDRSCAKQEDDFSDCVYRELTCVQKENCASCLAKEGIQNIEEWNACYDINDSLCKAIRGCDCGSCRGMAESWFDCIVDENSHGCQVQCGKDPPRTEPRTVDPAPRANDPRASSATDTNVLFALTVIFASLAFI